MNKKLKVLILPGFGQELSRERAKASYIQGLCGDKSVIIAAGGNFLPNGRKESELVAAHLNHWLKNMKEDKPVILVEKKSLSIFQQMEFAIKKLEQYLCSGRATVGLLEQLEITVAVDNSQLALFGISMKAMIDKYCTIDQSFIKVEVRMVELHIPEAQTLQSYTAAMNDLKKLKILHKRDRCGESDDAKLQVLIAEEAINTAIVDTPYAKMPLITHRQLFILESIFGEYRKMEPKFFLNYSNSARDENVSEMQYPEAVSNITWGFVTPCAVLNPVAYLGEKIFAEEILMNPHKRVKSEEFRNLFGTFFCIGNNAKIKQFSVRARSFEEGVAKMFEECTKPVSCNGLVMTPFVIFNQGENHLSLWVYQYNPEDERFVWVHRDSNTDRVQNIVRISEESGVLVA